MRWRLKWAIAIVLGAIVISIVFATVAVVVPILASGGNGPQLASIVIVPALLVAGVLGVLVAVGSIAIGLLFDLIASQASRPVRVAAVVVGAAVGAVPGALAIDALLGWNLPITVAVTTVIAATGALAARIWVPRVAKPPTA